jgi:hypothetical protein
VRGINQIVVDLDSFSDCGALFFLIRHFGSLKATRRLAEGARILQINKSTINMLACSIHAITSSSVSLSKFRRSARLFQLERSECDLMKTSKALFFELMYDFQSECWNEFELPKLSLRELGPWPSSLAAVLTVAKKRSLFVSSHNVKCA